MKIKESGGLATTGGWILNFGEDTIVFQEPKDWSGSVLGDYPPQIDVKTSAKFTHQGDDGSMGAVVYVGPRKKGGSTECAWVFAWYTPGNGNANKTYVEVGPAEDYPKGNIDRWEIIKANLLNAPGHTSHAIDNVKTGAEASSSIKPGYTSVATSVFDVVKIK
uniref:Jasmonate-induced protein n=2 Tax=Chenopodium quinoa TaxID=63459 RepID=A0A803MNG3_CHEQI